MTFLNENKDLAATKLDRMKNTTFYGFMKQKQDKLDATETSMTFYGFYMNAKTNETKNDCK